MSDSLRASVEKLKQSSTRLNKITDEAAQVVQAVEAFLNRELSVGVEAGVQVASEPLDELGVEEITALGYHRWQGRFRIIVSVGIDPEQNQTKPWSEWDRETKLQTVKKLPELLEKIAAEVDAQVVEGPQQATTTVAEVLKVIERKGGK